MNIQHILTIIFEFIVSPLLILLSGFAVKWLNAKANDICANTDDKYVQKYVTMLDKVIGTTVTAVNQTYVEALKKEGSFDLEAQKVAFQTVYDTVMNSLTEEAVFYLNEIINDLDDYVSNKIEEQVKLQKMYK